MKKPGQVIVFRFPQTDLNEGKLRPALLVAPPPGDHKDWLSCMISTQMHHRPSLVLMKPLTKIPRTSLHQV